MKEKLIRNHFGKLTQFKNINNSVTKVISNINSKVPSRFYTTKEGRFRTFLKRQTQR
jgi:hypothetical protein